MNNTNLLIATFCLIVSCTGAGAQATPELKAFQEAAGGHSILFRGKQADPHERPANGNPYWTSSEFLPGEVVAEGNLYTDILVNIDAADGRALVRRPDNPLAVALPPEDVSAIRTQDATYVGVSAGDGRLPEGFYQVFGDGAEKVYKNVTKRMQSATRNMNGDPIGYYDPAYNPSLDRYYAISRTYYFVGSDGTVARFRNKQGLLRMFPERRKELRKALNEGGYNLPGIGLDDYCMALLDFVSR